MLVAKYEQNIHKKDFSADLSIMLIPIATPPPSTMALRLNAGHGLLTLEVSRSHITTHLIRKDCYRRVISSSLRPLPDNTQHTIDKDPCPRQDWNPLSQQASGHNSHRRCGHRVGHVNVYLRELLQVVVKTYLVQRCNHLDTVMNFLIPGKTGTLLSSRTTIRFIT